MRNNGGFVLSHSDDNSDARALSRLHKFYISGEIEGPDEYVETFETIRNAGPDDIVVLHINSFGGDMFTAIQFMRVIAETQAKVVASVEGACMSAATLIFLAASQYEISEHVSFMFHNYSKLTGGKGGELYDNITHERRWSETLLRKVYKHFLTEAEITSVLDSKDIWMDGPEVVKRLQTRTQKLFEEQRAKEQAELTTTKPVEEDPKPKPKRKARQPK